MSNTDNIDDAFDVAVWLKNKLGADDTWVNRGIQNIMKPEILKKLAELPQIFTMLRKPVKLKMLMGILHLPENAFQENLDQLVALVKQGIDDDDDEWIRHTASIVAFWMTKNKEFNENEVLNDITQDILEDLEAAKSMAEQAIVAVGDNQEEHMHILANIQLPGEGQFLNKNCLKYHYSNLISNNADCEDNEPLGTSDFVANGATIQNHRLNYEELIEKSKEAQQLIRSGVPQGITNRSRMIYSENPQADEPSSTTGFMKSDMSNLKKQLSSSFSSTKDRRNSSAVDHGRKIQILSTDEIAGLSKRKRKRPSVVVKSNSQADTLNESVENDTVEFQIPADGAFGGQNSQQAANLQQVQSSLHMTNSQQLDQHLNQNVVQMHQNVTPSLGQNIGQNIGQNNNIQNMGQNNGQNSGQNIGQNINQHINPGPGMSQTMSQHQNMGHLGQQLPQSFQQNHQPGYSLQTFNPETPYQQPYTPYQQPQIHHYQDPNYNMQNENSVQNQNSLQNQNNVENQNNQAQQNNVVPQNPNAYHQQQSISRQNTTPNQIPAQLQPQASQKVIKLKEIQRNYDAVGLSIHSTQSISALKSATDLQQPARDKILKFLNKEYTPNVVKEEIRLSLEKQPTTYSGNDINRPLETYTEKLYILCQDGNIELHTRILVESGRI